MQSEVPLPTVNELLCDPSYGLVREARPSQLTMAAAIEAILKTGGVYFCEAPVATGKTYAYLVPALLAQGLRVVVATAKKQLQDQIVGKDYPTLKQVLGTALPPVGYQLRPCSPKTPKTGLRMNNSCNKALTAIRRSMPAPCRVGGGVLPPKTVWASTVRPTTIAATFG